MTQPLEKRRSMTFEWMTITPEIAHDFLGHNTKNRHVTRRRVETYAADMAAGRWNATGVPLIFDVNGNLIDGQHRLLACIESDCSFTTGVIRGADESAQDFVDIGKSRGVADQLSLHGITNSVACAAIAKLLYIYDNSSLGMMSKALVPKAEIRRIATEQHEAIVAAYYLATKQTLVTASSLAFCYLLFRRRMKGWLIHSWLALRMVKG